MTNLLTVLPDFDVRPFTHLLPSLEKALISTPDLLTLDALDVAKRAQVPPAEVKKLSDAILEGLQADLDGTLPENNENDGENINSGLSERPSFHPISTLDDTLDGTLGGGIAPGYLTEIVGESAVGKTQFLLTLLLSVQLSPPRGCKKSALYISTEGNLQTSRLAQILRHHPVLSALSSERKPSLSRIYSRTTSDVEDQEHILRYLVPPAIKQQNIGLVVIDSIAANYRAEFDRNKERKGANSFAKRSYQLLQLGAFLRNLARSNNIAVVVANQVADRFSNTEGSIQAVSISQRTQNSRPTSPAQSHPAASVKLSQRVPVTSQTAPPVLSTDDPLALDHQQRFFTGWGDDPATMNFKTPSLGLTWTNQLATRIALLKQPIYTDRAYQPGEDREIAGWSRTAKAVFSAWCAESKVDLEIWEGGVRALQD